MWFLKFIYLWYLDNLAPFIFEAGLYGDANKQYHGQTTTLQATFPTLCEKCMGSSLAKQYREDAGDSLLSSSKKIRMPSQLQIS